MNPLITSIIELELALDVRVTNEPINRARGNHAQADAEKESAADLRRALKILKGAKRIKNALDMLGLALTEHGHKWQPEERASYEKASRILANVPRQVSLAGAAGGSQRMGAKAHGLLFCQQALCLSGGTSNGCSSKLQTGQRLTARACSEYFYHSSEIKAGPLTVSSEGTSAVESSRSRFEPSSTKAIGGTYARLEPERAFPIGRCPCLLL